MAVFSTLSELKKVTEKKSTGGGGGDFPKRLSLAAGESRKIRFLQELTQDADNYNEERGTAKLIEVVTSPVNWRKQARSTANMAEHDFKCFGTENAAKDYKWRPRQHILIAVAAYDKEEDTWESLVLDQKFNPAHITDSLIEMAEEFGSITDRDFRISRTGEKQNTSYTIIPLDRCEEPEEVKNLELQDLDRLYRIIPYEKQEEFFLGGDDGDDDEDKPASSDW